VLEQNYEYDLLNPQKLLDKYVGKEVKLYQKNPYTEREEIVTATLLSNNGARSIKSTMRLPSSSRQGDLPGRPENLISKPTLVWLIENSLSSPQKVEASYLTNNITWRADYVITLNAKDDSAGLSGWVTIDNKSGATYRDAKLKLVAGDVNRVRDEQDYKAQNDASREQQQDPLHSSRKRSFSNTISTPLSVLPRSRRTRPSRSAL